MVARSQPFLFKPGFVCNFIATWGCRDMKLFLVAFILIGLGFISAPAQADTINWQLKSFSRNAVNVKFYSMNRNHQWPSASSHYPLKDYNLHKIAISCVNGEKVCYGAVVAGGKTYWGRGADGKRACTSCCYTCTGNVTTTVLNLNER
jgi:hypothetical protein